MNTKNTQQFQLAFDSLAQWEREAFIENNEIKLLADAGLDRPDLNEVETEDIALWLMSKRIVTAEELLDSVVDNLDDLRSYLEEDAESEYVQEAIESEYIEDVEDDYPY